MNIKEVWSTFKNSSILDSDMQKAMRRACTPNACIELLEENEQQQVKIKELEEELNEAIEIIEHCGIDYDEILEALKGGDL